MVGDILTVINDNEEFWWQARDSKGDYGSIPKKFVEEIADGNSKFI